MKITVDNKEVEAYRLIMRKENALDILSGKKKVEIRTYSDNYCGLFFDKEKLAKANEVFNETGSVEDEEGNSIFESAIKDVRYVYFTNYNNTWSLVVSLDWVYIMNTTKDWVEFLNENYNFHDLDNEWQQFEELAAKEKYEEIPSFFALAIKEVVSQKGLN